MTPAALLELFNDLVGRPATDAASLNAKKYTWLARAQDEVISEIASVKPSALYPKSTIPQMSTTDRNIFTFGETDDDVPLRLEPFGSCQIFTKLTDIPDRPWRPGLDYLDEGDQIRLPRNRTYNGTLYYRGIIMPPAISSTQAPALIPSAMNELTGIRAARNFAEGANVRNSVLADRMRRRWAERFPYWCLILKRQFSSGGALMTWSLKDVVTPLL